jgi:chain length determinant protein EpsF
MLLELLLEVVRARWRFALAVQLLVFGVVVGASLALPKRYTASASVLVDFKAQDPVAGTTFAAPMLSMLMANETGVIQSERVMLRTISDMRLLEDPLQREKWLDETDGTGDYPAWLAARLSRNLDVKASREGSFITVQYTGASPVQAAAMANAIVQAYVDTSVSLRVEPAGQYNRFFEERAKGAREALEAAQRRLSAFQRSKGIVLSDERLDVENARLTELSSRLVALEALAFESESRQRKASGHVDNLPEAVSSSLLGGLKTTLAQQESRLTELESRLGDSHPQVIELKASIAQARARIRDEGALAVGGLAVVSGVNRSRVAEMTSALEAQRAKLLQRRSQRDEAAVLERDVDSARRAYDAALGRLNQSGLESQLKQTNVSSLKTATPPTRPSSPKVALNAAVAFVLGALLAAGAVFVRERSDRRLRTVQDVVMRLGQPVLGMLPGNGRTTASAVSRTRVLTGMTATLGRLDSP